MRRHLGRWVAGILAGVVALELSYELREAAAEELLFAAAFLAVTPAVGLAVWALKRLWTWGGKK